MLLPVLLLFWFGALLLFWQGYLACVRRRDAFGLCPFLYSAVYGAFVWGDAVVLGLFWMFVVVALLFLQNAWLTGLVYSVYWWVRALGEVIYWLNEQFAVKHRNPPESLAFSRYFPGDSIWFVFQLWWQMVMVVATVVAVWCGWMWTRGL